MRPRWRTAVGALALAVGTSGALAGCGVLESGVYEAPLPGGADVGDDPLELVVEFTDVLDLVPQSAVKVDDVPVGRVTRIELADDGRSARVTILVNRDTALPTGTTARLQQTSLLGEKYVSLVRPADGGDGGTIASGTVLTTAETDQAAQVEQVLGALSLVLNGGGIAQFQEISTELQAVSGDDPQRVRTFLQQLEGFVTQLDGRKEAITAAIDGLAQLSGTLEDDRDALAAALDGLQPGLETLADQRPQLVAMLESLDALSDVAVSTLDAAQDDIVADLQALAPILDRLAAAGAALPESLRILMTYPFPAGVAGAVRGDYLNVFVTTAFASLPEDCVETGCPWPQPVMPFGDGAAGAAQRPAPMLLPPTASATPGLPSPTLTAPPTTGPTGTPSPTTSPTSPTTSPTTSPSGPTGSPTGPTGSPTGSPTSPSSGTTGPEVP